MHVIHNVVLDCSAMLPTECSDACLVALQHGVAFALKANAPTDTVHGTVSIVHNDPPEAHIITVNVYDADEAPTAQMVHGEVVGRQSTLKRPDPMPTEQAIKDRIDTLV
jgi:predicted kinase